MYNNYNDDNDEFWGGLILILCFVGVFLYMWAGMEVGDFIIELFGLSENHDKWVYDITIGGIPFLIWIHSLAKKYGDKNDGDKK